MCGIFASLTAGSNIEILKNIFKMCEERIKRRGPDYFNFISTKCSNWQCLLSSSVLWLQGPEITKQPIDTCSSLFLFNGDVFGGSIISCEERQKYGDTSLLIQAIENAHVTNILPKIQGPFAFIYIDKVNNKLYFGRDTYGRRSLLIGVNNDTILITSVAGKELPFPIIELPAIGIFCVDLNSTKANNFTLFPWENQNQNFLEKLHELEMFLKMSIRVSSQPDNKDCFNCNIILPEKVIVEQIENLKPDECFQFLELDKRWKENINNLDRLIRQAVKKRINNQPPFCNICVKEKISCVHATAGVLFSGGIDCTLLALVADQFIDSERPIDLINVAFEFGNGFNVPDRVTAKESLEELKKLCPTRKWNLLEVNVSVQELHEERSKQICHHIYPLQSILDESLGCALWFAARGKTENYTSPCRVLLVGMGADELFGGYTRHRAAFKRGKWNELTKELDNDWKNISHRNLARDDRVVSDHGRQLRTPYLDETVVEFIRKLNTWEKCYPSEKVRQGLGDKLLLRALAHRLGLKQPAIIKKRALQFGSRIANSKENAYDRSPRL